VQQVKPLVVETIQVDCLNNLPRKMRRSREEEKEEKRDRENFFKQWSEMDPPRGSGGIGELFLEIFYAGSENDSYSVPRKR
jgi:hypothetical protein